MRELSLKNTGKKTFAFGENKVNRNCSLEESWIWPEQVTELVSSLIIGKSINVCCGASALGDVKVDLQPLPELALKNNIQIEDMNDLPFEDDSFDTVISDPPWKLPFFKRMRPFLECVRICKVGGRIIYNSYHKPVSKYVVLEKAYIRSDNNWSNCLVIWIFKKVREIEPTLSNAESGGKGGIKMEKEDKDLPYEQTEKYRRLQRSFETDGSEG